MKHRDRARQSEVGFSLIEALVATLLLAGGVAAVAQLAVVAVQANGRARATTTATVLARHKVEQLRALTFGADVDGSPVTDTTTDTRATPETATGGTGLTSSPVDALTANVGGYCDFADADGRPVVVEGDASVAPPGAAFLRRWSVTPLPANPARSVVIQVVVLSAVPALSGQVTRLTDVRTRRSF